MSIFRRKKPIVHPIPPPTPARTLLFTLSSTLFAANEPPSRWQGMGLSGLVVPINDAHGPADTFSLFDPAMPASELAARVKQARALSGSGELWLGIGCTNVRAAPRHLYPWTDDAGWAVIEANHAALSAAAASVGATGIVFDTENYDAYTRGAGSQDPLVAWPAGDPALVEARARQFAASLRSAGPILLAANSTYMISKNTPEFDRFVRTMALAAPGMLMFDDDGFNGTSPRAAIRVTLGTDTVPTLGLNDSSLRDGSFQRAASVAAANCPAGRMVYAWDPAFPFSMTAGEQAALKRALGE